MQPHSNPIKLKSETYLLKNMTESIRAPEEYLAVCWPAISGFNFTHKCWGYALVDSIHEIQFNNDAFEQLVLEHTRKQLIYAVVKNSQEVFSDIIAGKGGGSIVSVIHLQRVTDEIVLTPRSPRYG